MSEINPATLPYANYSLVVDGEVASNFRVCVAFEAKVAAMSSNPTIEQSGESEDFYFYDVIVDGELAFTLRWSKSDERTNAVFQSNPTVIELTDEQLEIGIGPGWFWNGTEFTETPQ